MRKANKTGGAIEITTFKLAGYTCKQFIAANADIDIWLKQQAGFVSRQMAEYEDGTIYDMLIWDSVSNGRLSMTRLMSEMAHSPVHDMIDQGTVSWRIAAVKHHVKNQ